MVTHQGVGISEHDPHQKQHRAAPQIDAGIARVAPPWVWRQASAASSALGGGWMPRRYLRVRFPDDLPMWEIRRYEAARVSRWCLGCCKHNRLRNTIDSGQSARCGLSQ